MLGLLAYKNAVLICSRRYSCIFNWSTS